MSIGSWVVTRSCRSAPARSRRYHTMLIAPRRKTRVLEVGNVKIGGDNPIVVQSMTTADTRDPKATLKQIAELADAGCEIARVAVPDRVAAAALPEIVPYSPI